MKLKIFLTFFIFPIFLVNAWASEDLIITEVLPNPYGDDKSGEFIEIYNPTEFEVNINDYYIDTYQITNYSEETFQTLASKEFLIIHDNEIDLKQRFPGSYKRAVVESLTTRGLSNTGDIINLIRNGVTIDSFEYVNSLDGQSIIKPLINCSYQRNSEKKDSIIDNTSIGKFDNIFDIKDFEFSLEYYYQGEWVFNNSLFNINSLPFRLYSSNICNLENKDFNYQILDEIFSLEDLNTLEIPNNTLNTINIKLKHNPSLSDKEFQLEIDNRISPTPIQSEPTITPSPSTIPTPSITTSPTPQLTITPFINNYNNYKQIRINEIYPTPDAGENEWLELYNFGNEEVNLENFILKDETGSHIIKSTTISSGGYLVIEDPDLKISLNNSGDRLKLINPAGDIISEFIYSSTEKGHSNIIINNLVVQTDNPTKRLVNIYNTNDLSEGIIDDLPTEEQTENVNDNNSTLCTDNFVQISAIYPSPQKGENEWLELANNSDKAIILDGWKLKDRSSSQDLTGIEFPANSKLKLSEKNLKITLNNAGEEISLINSCDNTIDNIIYPKISKGTIFIPNIIQNTTESNTEQEVESVEITNQNNIPQEKETKIKKPTSKINIPKIPQKYDSDKSKTKLIIPTIIEENRQPKMLKDTGILLISLTGFINTNIGKSILKILFNKLENWGS